MTTNLTSQEKTQQEMERLLSKLDWWKIGEDKNHNAFVDETKKTIYSALQDDSPDMRAVLLVGIAQLLYLRRVHEKVLSQLPLPRKTLFQRIKDWIKSKKFPPSIVLADLARTSGKLDNKVNLHVNDSCELVDKLVTNEATLCQNQH